MRQHIETIFRYRCFQGCLQNSIQTIEYYIFQIVERCLMLCESLEWTWWHRKRLDENLRKEKNYAILALFSFLSESRCSERFPYCSNPRLVRSTFQNVLVIVHLHVCTQIQSTLITNNLKGQREKLMCYNKLPLQNIIFQSSSVFYFCTSV